MKKIISLLLIAVLLVGMTPADLSAAESFGEKLKKYGFIDGGTGGALMENDYLTRDQLAKITAELFGESELAKNYTQPPSFYDVQTFQPWAIKYISYAQYRGWMNGKPTAHSSLKTFDPAGRVSQRELASVMLRALGLYVSFETSVIDASRHGINLGNLPFVKRGQAFEAMWQTVAVAVPKGETLPLGVKSGKIPTSDPLSDSSSFSLVSVSTDNLRKMTLTFNKPVDKESISTKTLKVLSGNTNLIVHTLLSEDGLKLDVEIQARKQGNAVILEVDGVKSTKGESVTFSKNYVLSDSSVPTLDKVVGKNQKTVVMYFSEPMLHTSTSYFTTQNTFKINGRTVVGKVSTDALRNTLTLTVNAPLSTGNHVLEIKDLYDFAGYKMSGTFDFTVVPDRTAPEAIAVEVLNRNTLLLSFDEELSTAGVVKVNGVNAQSVSIEDRTKVRVSLASPLGIAALVEVQCEYQAQADLLSNRITGWKLIRTKVADDTELPTASITKVLDGRIEITFSKSMQYNRGIIEITDKDGKNKKTLTYGEFTTGDPCKEYKYNAGSWDKNRKVLSICLYSLRNVDSSAYKMTLTGFYDDSFRENPLQNTVIDFTSFDTKVPTLLSNYKVQSVSGGKQITLYFSEAMDTATISNLSNYRIGTVTLSAINGASFVGQSENGKDVTLFIPNTHSGMISVIAVRDLAGNMISSWSSPSSTVSPTLVVLGGAQTSDRKIELTFSEEIEYAYPDFLSVVIDSYGSVIKPISATIHKNNKKVVLFEFDYDISTVASEAKVFESDVPSVVSVYQTMLTGVKVSRPIHITDQAGPIAKEIKYLGNNRFEVKMSEHVMIPNVDAGNPTEVKQALDKIRNYFNVIVNNQILPFEDAVIESVGNSSPNTLIYKINKVKESGTYEVYIDHILPWEIADRQGNYLLPFVTPKISVDLVETP